MNNVKDLFRSKTGLEVGGPTAYFHPLYSVVASIDGCNFSDNTIWEGKLTEGRHYINGKGYQYICDAVELSRKVSPEAYDFIISGDCLEHIANPLKALREFVKSIKGGGLLMIVVPRKESNFDHRRPTTTFKHIRNDFSDDVGEDDLSHLKEILELHDLSRDLAAGDYESFKNRSIRNYFNRALHHHIFDMDLLRKIFRFLGLKIVFNNETETSYIIIGKK